jgi:hypothetical protein
MTRNSEESNDEPNNTENGVFTGDNHQGTEKRQYRKYPE